MSNYIQNKKIIFDDREPPWFDRKIKNLIKYKNQIYKDTPYHKSNFNFQFHFRYIKDLINIKKILLEMRYDEPLSIYAGI